MKEHYQIVKFDDDCESISGDAVAITFDDGYVDNYRFAVPILEKYQIPATIFVTTGNIDTNREFWWDEFERALLQGTNYNCWRNMESAKQQQPVKGYGQLQKIN